MDLSLSTVHDERGGSVLKEALRHYSVLIKGARVGSEDVIQEVFRVQLPGEIMLGEGKPENQNHAIIFTRGEAIQTIDMNQCGYLEESFKSGCRGARTRRPALAAEHAGGLRAALRAVCGIACERTACVWRQRAAAQPSAAAAAAAAAAAPAAAAAAQSGEVTGRA